MKEEQGIQEEKHKDTSPAIEESLPEETAGAENIGSAESQEPVIPAEKESPAGVSAVEESAVPADVLIAENQRLKDQLLRLAAEFDNYRKRNDREMQNYLNLANYDLMAKLLPVLDDLDRIIAAGEGGTEQRSLFEGVCLLQKNMLKAFQEGGVAPMQTIGEEFDPQLHDALLHIEVADEKPNTVVEEHKKGYYFKGKVLRHAQVVVSK